MPALVISPWAPRASVAHGLYDHTSILKMIEARWNLRPLTVRDASANNLAEVLNFDRPNLTAPRFNVPLGPFGTPPASQSATPAGGGDNWEALAEMALASGFTLSL